MIGLFIIFIHSCRAHFGRINAVSCPLCEPDFSGKSPVRGKAKATTPSHQNVDTISLSSPKATPTVKATASKKRKFSIGPSSDSEKERGRSKKRKHQEEAERDLSYERRQAKRKVEIAESELKAAKLKHELALQRGLHQRMFHSHPKPHHHHHAPSNRMQPAAVQTPIGPTSGNFFFPEFVTPELVTNDANSLDFNFNA